MIVLSSRGSCSEPPRRSCGSFGGTLLINRFPREAGSISALIRTCPSRSAGGDCAVPARKSRGPSPGVRSFCRRLNRVVAALASVCRRLPGDRAQLGSRQLQGIVSTSTQPAWDPLLLRAPFCGVCSPLGFCLQSC